MLRTAFSPARGGQGWGEELQLRPIFLREKMGDRMNELSAISNPWPLEKDAFEFYGDPRGNHGAYSAEWAHENLVHVPCPWQIHMGEAPVPFILIHRKCAESLHRVLWKTWDAMGQSQANINKAGFGVFSGSFNYRCIRGATAISMHAFGAAIDWDAPDNPMGFGNLKHRFSDATPLIANFKEEGWRWGGDYHGRHDFMHVEACR